MFVCESEFAQFFRFHLSEFCDLMLYMLKLECRFYVSNYTVHSVPDDILVSMVAHSRPRRKCGRTNHVHKHIRGVIKRMPFCIDEQIEVSSETMFASVPGG
jgi:hypothetical protein